MSALAWKALAREVQRDPDSYIDERDRRRLAAFTKRMFPGYETAAHILTLVDALEWAVNTPGSRLIVTLPPRHSKSLHVSEHLPAWFLGRFPDKRVIGASHTQELANTFSRRVRNKIADPRYPFPGIDIAGDKAAVKAWDIAGRLGGYYAVGVGGTPTGIGCDLMILDDPLRSAADADSQLVRENLWEWYRETMYTRLEPGASIILTATRWSDDDLTGRLIAAEATGGDIWRHVHMPALDDSEAALWPERWPAEALHRIKATIGTRAFESQYQGSPVPPEGGMFKRHWWGRYTDLPPITRAEIMVDSAFKDGVANDYSVFALWGTDGHDNLYLLRLWREKVEFPGLIQLGHTAMRWAKEAYPTLRIPLVVEDKASGQSAIQTWDKPYYTRDGVLPALPVIPFPAESNKVARAEGVTPTVEGGRAHIPERSIPHLDDWLTEHDRFPHGAHDDCVDTTSMGITRLGAKKHVAFGGR